MPTMDVTIERTQTAERHVGFVRLAVVTLNSIAYFLTYDVNAPARLFAYGIIAAAITYSLFIVLFEPYRRYPVLLSSRLSTASDASLIMAWLLATGGLESPFYLLWYLSLVAVAYRYNIRATIVAAVAYSAAYVLVGVLSGHLLLHATDLALRIGYIGITGAMLAMMTGETHQQMRSRVAMGDRMRQAESAEARFRGLLEAAPDPIVIVDAQGNIALVNGEAEEAFGYQREELLGQHIELLLPRQSAAIRAAQSTLGSPEARHRDPAAEGVRKDGTHFPAEISLSPMQTDEGTLVTSIIHDITERKKAEAERLTSLERLKELERLRELDTFKTTFINTAAHELGTPLTPIKLQLHILKSAGGNGATPKQVRAIEVLDRNVDRLNHLVQEVLKVARLQAGRLGISIEDVDINGIVNEVAESFDEPAREAGIRLEVRTRPGLRAEADAKRLTQVLFNLLNNAWKFTPRGGHITIETESTHDEVIIRVRDSGAGIASEDISKLFQPFSQVHDTMQHTVGGTGLGLYICKGIIELHKGRIWVESEGAGKGSMFGIAIPITTPRDAPVEVVAQPSAVVPPVIENAKLPDTIAKRARELI